MEITLIKEKEEVWEDFYQYCKKSKPYRKTQVGSRTTQEAIIRRLFNDFCKFADIYLFSDEERLGYAFITTTRFCHHVDFVFGVAGLKFSKMIKGFHKCLDFVNESKYFTSEIRRTYKSKIYKKWLDRYETRAIILNNEDETVLWYNSEEMKGKLQVVGANEMFKHLLGETVYYDSIVSSKTTDIATLEFDGQEYLLDVKEVKFEENQAVIKGMISNNKDSVGRVTLLFKP